MYNWRGLLLLLMVLSFSRVWAEKPIQVDLYLSSTCPHCQKVDQFFLQLQQTLPWLTLQKHYINQDKQALDEFSKRLSKLHQDDFRVPSIFFCDTRWVGFDSPETTGQQLLKALKYCHQQWAKQGHLSVATKDVLQHWAAPTVYTLPLDSSQQSWGALPVLAWVDAFSPCSLFVFLGFLAWTNFFNATSRRIILGAVLLLLITIIHTGQQLLPQLYFSILPWLRLPAILAGLLMIAPVWKIRNNNPYPFWITCSLAGLGMGFVMLYQQTCLLNWAYFFQEWLAPQNISPQGRLLAQLIYELAYLLPLVLFFIIFLLWNNKKRSENYKYRLHCICMLLILSLGLILVLDPPLLAQMAWAVILGLPLIVLGWLLGKHRWGPQLLGLYPKK